ncbi:hypothetical protein MMC08_006752, partial [Hypocenomyce scalaris]|nr:hypothetical protein [Hypocenomyce scalaris]
MLARDDSPFDEVAKRFAPDAIFRPPNGKEVPPTRIEEVLPGESAKYIRHHVTMADIQFVTENEARVETNFGAAGAISSSDKKTIRVPVTILERDKTPLPVPRAPGYFGASMFALKRADIWEAVRDQGVTFSSLGWRKVAADIGNGSKDWGEEIPYWNLAEGSPYKEGDCGWGMTILGQHQLRE